MRDQQEESMSIVTRVTVAATVAATFAACAFETEGLYDSEAEESDAEELASDLDGELADELAGGLNSEEAVEGGEEASVHETADADEIAADEVADELAAEKASWHNGPWGPRNDGVGVPTRCRFEFGGKRAHGLAYKQGHVAEAKHDGGSGQRRVQVRGKRFTQNAWGLGNWGYSHGQIKRSRHDCGVFACALYACRTSIWH
jgi:hypothetical protein